ncbi:ATP-grasp domain-containing protein [Cystobacter ferrugineus]|uniref:ATP-grasp domain-containing protein n=1 Tax=Cystobacter ferrugineus TaxID=83449 RepID=A0A1L9AWC8_9BACT|nr:ATP-grasp domain-containing protein [Cystobacter ferrugineus]OJH34294.1 hypothetical protein BON30_44070 [Cystobacter ferrugineus]
MDTSPSCAIVDGYGPANHLLPMLQARGIPVVHVQSSDTRLRLFAGSLMRDRYVSDIVFRGDVEEVANRLRSLRVAAVFAGFETGVELADALSTALKSDSNGVALSRARRDKAAMADALRAAGLRAPRGAVFTEIDAACGWVHQELAYPVVVKPLASGGTDAVRVCGSDEELRAAAQRVLSSSTIFDTPNEAFLVQEFLRGREYVVNTVSCDGFHFVSDMWAYDKRLTPEGHIVYDRDVLLPFSGEEQEQLRTYALKVLDALGIRFGPAHAEIMLTERGPVLVEIGARLAGATNPQTDTVCLGHNQAELTLDAYLDKPRFFARTRQPYELRRRCIRVSVPSMQEGIITAIPLANTAKELPTFAWMRIKRAIGDRLPKTVDLQTEVALVDLIAETSDELERDYRRLLELARTGFVVE